jgi:uncharacterized protein YqeY
MTIKEQINNDVKDAMRARDQKKLSALRLITAAIKQVEVDERIDVDEVRLLVILDKLVKQRNESISQFKAAGRDDLVAQEQFELDVLNQYLPEPLTDAEITRLIEQALLDTGALKMSDMGKVMAQVKPQMQGRADMAKVSVLIKAKLS